MSVLGVRGVSGMQGWKGGRGCDWVGVGGCRGEWEWEELLWQVVVVAGEREEEGDEC